MFTGETVTVLTAGTKLDSFGHPVEDWANPTSVDVDNVLVGAGGSTEDRTNAANVVDSDFDLIFQPPISTTPTPANRIVVRGLTCNVVGRPFRWVWPASSGDAGLVVKAQIREGG